MVGSIPNLQQGQNAYVKDGMSGTCHSHVHRPEIVRGLLVSPILQKRGYSVQSAGCAMRAVTWFGRAPG